MLDAKHLATFILGAAAGVALHKYSNTEEGQKALDDLKTKAADLQGQAQSAMDNAPAYFEKLKNEGAAALKDSFPGAEKFLNDLMSGNTPTANTTTVTPITIPVEEAPKA